MFQLIPQPWMDRARCAQADPEIFYPDKSDACREAKLVCRSCPVKVECLDYATTHSEKWGVWGGMSSGERARFQRRKPPIGA